ncbi:MAG: response regulator [Chitinophagales bacterium]
MNSLKFFVVDDNKAYAYLLIKTLENEGFQEIEYYESGKKCIENLNNKPDIILLDHHMPGMTGLETLKEIKKQLPGVYVINVSGQEQTDIAVGALKAGAYDYIIKGDNEFEALIEIINKIRNISKTEVKHSLVEKHKTQPYPNPISLFQKNKIEGNLFAFILAITAFIALSSCSTQNLLTQASTKSKDADDLINNNTPSAYTIQQGDKLSVSIWDHDDLSVGSIFTIYNSNEVYGKWLQVDPDGNIALPGIGTTKVEGLSLTDCEKHLSELYKNTIVNPLIEIRVLNWEASVLGEVRNPGNISLENEKQILLEVIALAGDFEPYADKKNVKVVRMQDGNTIEYNINLVQLESELQSKLFIYPGDIIYIPSRKGKILDIKSQSLIPIASVLTAAAILYSTLNK